MGGGRGRGNRSRTQRKHFRDGRENVWKRSKSQASSDSNNTSTDNPTWQPFATQNQAFDEYYKEEGIVPPEEWDTFVEVLRTPLPAAFRINSSSQFCADIRSQLENDFMKSLKAEVTEGGGEVEAIRPLPWYPDNLAWHSNFSRMQLRKNQTLERFHEFLKLENEIGNITRQEAVSMVPPLFLDVSPNHFVLDMCAAPGSKTFQLLEIIYQSTKPGSLPDGMVIANDLDVQRCNLLIHQTKRMCTANLIVTNNEAQHFPGCRANKNFSKASEIELEPPISQLLFDRVLCDVPCSGDGTLRKAPDLWRKWNSGMGNGLHPLQIQIAMRGLSLLKVGGRMVYSTCSMNPVENEAVVAEILRRCGGSVELVDVSSELPQLVRRPGLRNWKVRDRGIWLSSHKDALKFHRFGILPSMFPSGRRYVAPTDGDHKNENVANVNSEDEPMEDPMISTDDWNEEVSDIPLERCMRIVPHDQNSGAFFIAVLHKLSPLPVIQEKPSRRGNSLTKRDEIQEKLSEQVTECNNGVELNSEDAASEKFSEAASEADLIEKEMDETASVPDPCNTDDENDSEKAKLLIEGETPSGKAVGKRKLQIQGKWKGVDPVIFFKDEAIINSIKAFYGIDESFPFGGHLISRNIDNNHVKRIYYISKSVKDVLELNLLVGQQLKIASVGLKMFVSKYMCYFLYFQTFAIFCSIIILLSFCHILSCLFGLLVEKEPDKAGVSEGKGGKEVDEMQKCEKNSNDNSVTEDKVGNVDGDEGGEGDHCFKEPIESKEDDSREVVIEKPAHLEEKSSQEKGIDLEAKMEDVEVAESNKEVNEDNGGAEVDTGLIAEDSGQNLKDKGKSVAFFPTLVADSVEDGKWSERESRKVPTCKDEDDMEGPSIRGFELFTSSPVKRAEKAEQSGVSKPKEEKLVLESLDLSLSLPNVLLPIGAAIDAPQAPGSPSNGRSVQSYSTFCTNSDGFTASVSFSGSHSFFHNPSCSLTQNSLDMDNYEQSVHSRPIFQGVDQANWQCQAQNDTKLKGVPLYQRVLMNGNGSFHQSQALQGMSNGQTLQGSSKMANGLERQLSFHKQLSGGQSRNPDETGSPSHSVGSHEIGTNYSLEKKRAMREKHGGSLYRSNSQKEQEQLLIGGADFVESIISRIVSDPIHATARKFHEMTGQSASLVKESIREIMLNVDKQGQLYAFQSALENRSDLTLGVLLKSHRFHLEILVALKTGLREYLQVDNNISSSDLAEVFLNLRCRNLACRSPLPVDECDCKVCGKKNGFCSACMCLVCSKFDMAYQTCSWVGCDVCLHWCHADCALRESNIRNGRSANGAQGTSEVQFHCVACDHPSEMFGFVKEVFQNFAKTWTAETFCKELEYVKRIFSASKDFRGRRLHEIANRMLEKLANKANISEVYSNIIGFLTESESSKFGNPSGISEKERGNGSNGGIAGPSQESSWLKSVYSEKAPKLERSSSFLPSFHTELNDKRPVESELERIAQKEPIFDELESIVRIKQAEAKMFQARADDARREAEGLKRIALAKNEKVEEEYRSRITKLRLVEAEEMRKQKYEEFKTLERAHQEYFSMKMRMEADIKDLLLKMEATKRNLAM